MPPMAAFVSKWHIGTAAIASGDPLAIAGMFAVLFSAFCTAVYICGFVMRAFLPFSGEGDWKTKQACDPTWRMKLPLGILVYMIFTIGMFAKPLLAFLGRVASGGL